MILFGCFTKESREPIDVGRLLEEMADFEELALRPDPLYMQASASSYRRESHKGGDAWFDNLDRGQYERWKRPGATASMSWRI